MEWMFSPISRARSSSFSMSTIPSAIIHATTVGYPLALEDLVTLYTNRIDNDQGFDLRKNNFFNPIVGNLFENLAMIEANNLDKLESLLLNNFERALPKEMVYKRFVKEGIRITESTFDSYCEKLTGKTYYQAMNDRILKTSAIPSPLDAKTRSWLANKFTKEKLATLLWTRIGPDGNIKPLFLGYHLSGESGIGFIHSFINYRRIYTSWFISKNNKHPRVTCKMISELLYDAIQNNDFSLDETNKNRYKYDFIYNDNPISFFIEFNSNSGEIKEIEPLL